jgi:NAD(P)-dependent dehydrogenase (short-subunit alcohol dehydrogenase family)
MFASKGLLIFGGVRAPSEATELNALAARYPGKITVLRYEALEAESAERLKSAVGATPIDLLLANAGASTGPLESFGSVGVEAAVELFRINSIAPLKLVEAFADNVARSERKLIALQSSQLGSISNNTSGGFYGYRMSKAALNMVAKGLSSDLRPLGVTVVALHPGWVKTRMGGPRAPLSVEKSVEDQQRLFEKLTIGQSGRFFNFDGTKLPW